MALSGFKYFWDGLGLDDDSYLVHYDFTQTGSFVRSSQGGKPLYSGQFVSGVPAGFWSVGGSGQFGTGVLAIQNATGLSSSFWTHFIVYERKHKEGGVLFSSLETSPGRTAGYALGVTDNNRLYFQHKTSGGPVAKVSNQIYGEKNAVAIVKTGDILTFHIYNFDTKETSSDSFNLATYDEESFSASIGGAVNAPSYVDSRKFKGFIDEYVYVTEALIPSNVRVLFSGFYSEYREQPAIINTTGYYAVTGFDYAVTGATGVVGYDITENLSGTDKFGDPVYVTTQTPRTGYLLSGLIQIPKSGYIQIQTTGEPTGGLYVDENFGRMGFGFKEISKLNKNSGENYYLTTSPTDPHQFLNLRADFDRVKGNFEMSDLFEPSLVSVFKNGIKLNSGEYHISGFNLGIVGPITEADVVIYDVLSGIVLDQHTGSAIFNGLPAFQKNTSRLFVNGIRQVLGETYIENTPLDLLGPSGLFETGLKPVYNGETNFLQ